MIRLDHSTGIVHLETNGRDDEFRSGQPIRIPSGRRVAVVVNRTNSALYSCTATQSEINVPELDTLKSFTGKLGDYLPTLGMALGLAGAPDPNASREDQIVAEIESMAEQLATSLEALDSLSAGPTGMRATHQRVLRLLGQMRLMPDSVDTAATGELRAWLLSNERCTTDDCDNLTYADDIHTIAQEIRTTLVGLQVSLSQATESKIELPVTLKTTTTDLITAGEKALSDFSQLANEAYALERMTIRLIDATSVIPCASVEVTWDRGRALTISVAPRSGPEIEPIANRPALEHKADVYPDWLIRPSLGLTFLVVPGAEYPKYTTTTVEEGMRIDEGDIADRRFTYGLTLGLTYRPLDARRSNGIAVWLPDLTINPTSDVQAVAIGGGISYRMLKVSIGRAYTRHSVLNGQNLGQILTSADQLSTRQTFGSGRWYFGVSMIGLPPFVQGSD